jgi:hypothetical protein
MLNITRLIKFQYLNFVEPLGASTFVEQIGVGTADASILALVIPNFFGHG